MNMPSYPFSASSFSIISRNAQGQTAFDLADEDDMLPYLEEMKKKQASVSMVGSEEEGNRFYFGLPIFSDHFLATLL